jgi:putative transposase
MKLQVSVTELVDLIKEVQMAPARIFEILGMDIRKQVGDYLSQLMDVERTQVLGRAKYERTEDSSDHRNGSYERTFCMKGIGEVTVRIPRDREGKFHTQVIPRGKQYEDRIVEDLSAMYLTGISTRTLSLLSKRLIGRSISPTEISNANKELTESVEKWRTRDLSHERIKYMYVDGVIFRMRVGGSVENVPVLVAIGVTVEGTKLVLGLQSGDKESATSWREFFRDLKLRGLEVTQVKLGVMDGLPGLEKVFAEEFPHARVQRCQVHVARNVLAKVTRAQKREVADDMRSIFYASSRSKADAFFKEFHEKWNPIFPSAVKCLQNSLDSCLTFFSFPEEEWISLRTTNVIERLNKEFKRRTKPMEIVAGEHACYRLLAFIALKMELSWRSNKVGKVRPNLPLYKLTQKA